MPKPKKIESPEPQPRNEDIVPLPKVTSAKEIQKVADEKQAREAEKQARETDVRAFVSQAIPAILSATLLAVPEAICKEEKALRELVVSKEYDGFIGKATIEQFFATATAVASVENLSAVLDLGRKIGVFRNDVNPNDEKHFLYLEGRWWSAVADPIVAVEFCRKARQIWATINSKKSTRISIEQLFNKLIGVCEIWVPPERIGRSFRLRSGGRLIVRTDGESIWLIEARGPIARGLDYDVFLKVSSLENDAPPYVRSLDSQLGRSLQLFWYLLKRAKLFEEELAVMTGTVNVSPEDFFRNSLPGVCLAIYKGKWDWEEDEKIAVLYNPLVLVRRSKDGEIEVLQEPTCQGGFFSEQGKGPFAEGDKFEGCPARLGAFLRACYGQQTHVQIVSATV